MKSIHALCLAAAGALLLPSAAEAITPVSAPTQGRKAPVERFHRPAQRLFPGIHPAPEMTTPSYVSAPSRITAGGTSLYGYMVAGHTQDKHGMYEFNKKGYTMKWADPLWNPSNNLYTNLQTGWYRNGRFCGFDHWFEYGYFWGQQYYEIDFNTGEIVKNDNSEDCIDNGWFVNACYDAENDMVYGYGTDDEEEASTALFMKTNGANPLNYEIVRDYGNETDAFNRQCCSMTWNSIDKKLYGINLNREFVTIDKETGNQTVLFSVPSSIKMGLYITGLCYSPVEDLFYWNCNYDNTDGSWGSSLYTIDSKTGKFTLIDEFEGGPNFSVLLNVGDNITADTPRRPTVKEINFTEGSTSGNIVYTMPDKSANGSTLSGTLQWAATVDGGRYENGNAAPGSDVTVEFSNLVSGMHVFGMRAINGSHESAEVTTEIYVGKDRPKAPEEVIFDEHTLMLRWAQVTEGVNGGYLDPAKMEYKVYLNGSLVTTTKRNTYQVVLPENAQIQKWSCSVQAVCDGMTSAEALSNYVVAGKPWQLPVDIRCNEENLELCKVVNVNGDDETWAFDDWENGWYSGQVDKGVGDDWVFLPAIEFNDPEKSYSFYMSCKRRVGVYDQTTLEVCYGSYPEPAMMKGNVIMSTFTPQSRDYKTFSTPAFKVPEAGTWYIGIRCVTQVDMCGCLIDEIRIEDNDITDNSPAGVTDLEATPGENGALNAKLSFRMPTKDVKGNAIDASKTLTAKISCVEETSVTGTPGQLVNTTVTTLQGDNQIAIQTFDGNVSGERTTVNVYTGVTVPGLVRDLSGTVSEDMLSLSMTWNAPNPDKYGGYVDPATTEYLLGIYDAVQEKWDLTPIGTGINAYTYTMSEGAPQDLYRIGILARNAAGDNGSIMSLNAHMGTPLKLSLTEDFENYEFAYQPWIIYKVQGMQNNSRWTILPLEDIATDWEGNTTGALVGYITDGAESECALAMPRFSTLNQEEVTVKVRYYAGTQAAGLSILGQCNAMNDQIELHKCVITGIDSPNEWKTAEVKLPASLLGKYWVSIFFDASFGADRTFCIIDNIQVLGDNDGVITAVNARGTVAAGERSIVITGYEGDTAVVATMGGTVATERKMTGEQTVIPVESGIYVVTVGGNSYKLIVK